MTKVFIDKALFEQAIDTLGYYASVCGEDDQETPAKQTQSALRAALVEPAVEPVKFLANGTRFKMSFFHNEDSEGQVAEGMYVTCFEGFEDELDGRWVALVVAEDDCHIKLNTLPPPPAEVPMLTDEEFEAIRKTCAYQFAEACRSGTTKAKTIMQATEAAVRQKAGL